MAIIIERYKQNNKKNRGYGKIYGRVKAGRTVGTRKLAEHIAGHGSIYTLDIIEGVLAKLEKCVPELLKQGYQVKLEGLGTFYLAANTIGAENAEDFSVDNIKRIGISFLPEQSDWSEWKATSTRAGAELQLTDYVVLQGATGPTRTRTLMYLTGDNVSADGESQGDDSGGGDGGGSGSGQEEAGEDRP